MEQHADSRPDGGTGGAKRESDEALRRVYGEKAQFSRVGAFTLVHLDGPSDDEIARRVEKFDPDDFFFDDCPLCKAAKAEGGHIVFDGSDDDPACAVSMCEDPDLENLPPAPLAGMFDTALVDLSNAAEQFGWTIAGAVPADLERRYAEEVAGLHDRIVETLWAAESERRIELFEGQLARAHTVIQEVRAAAPSLAPRSESIEAALDRVAAVWRGL